MTEEERPKKKADAIPVLNEGKQEALAASQPPALSSASAFMLPPKEQPAIAAPALVQLPPKEQPAIAAPATAPVPLLPRQQQAIAPLDQVPERLPPSQQPALASGTPSQEDPLRALIVEILGTARTVAVVGASDTPGKPSHRVTFYLMRAGFEVYPVNPAIKELGGRTAYPDLRSVPAGIDVVDIFRRPEAVLPVVEEAISVGAKAVWMQEGIINEEAAGRARAAGLRVVMDRCMMKEHRKLWGQNPD